MRPITQAGFVLNAVRATVSGSELWLYVQLHGRWISVGKANVDQDGHATITALAHDIREAAGLK